MNAPHDTPVALTLNLAELNYIAQVLADRPHKEVNYLLRSIEGQVGLALARAAQPAAPDEAPQPAPDAQLEEVAAKVYHDAFARQLPLASTTDEARAYLQRATYDARRTGDGTLNVPPLDDPDRDYAIACILVSGAMSQLDESLPNKQRDRTLYAYAALEHGTNLLGDYLGRRVE